MSEQHDLPHIAAQEGTVGDEQSIAIFILKVEELVERTRGLHETNTNKFGSFYKEEDEFLDVLKTILDKRVEVGRWIIERALDLKKGKITSGTQSTLGYLMDRFVPEYKGRRDSNYFIRFGHLLDDIEGELSGVELPIQDWDE